MIHVSESATVAAPPAAVYELIADYVHGHPAILPPRYFEGLVVERGGRGAGTVIRFTARAFGARETSRATITEPEPGRVLVETVEGGRIVTTFTVDPADGGTRVTIATDYATRGLRGWFERLVVPGYLRKVYREELELIARRA